MAGIKPKWHLRVSSNSASGVEVGVGVPAGVEVGVGAGVCVGVGVGIGDGVSVGVGVGIGDGVATGREVAVGVMVGSSSAGAAQPAKIKPTIARITRLVTGSLLISAPFSFSKDASIYNGFLTTGAPLSFALPTRSSGRSGIW